MQYIFTTLEYVLSSARLSPPREKMPLLVALPALKLCPTVKVGSPNATTPLTVKCERISLAGLVHSSKTEKNGGEK